MAASGYTPIILLNSTTTGNTPTTSNLAVGELAINVTDGKLFFNQSGTIKVLANATYATSVSTISFGTTGLTPSTATNGVVTVAGTLATTNGGTGLTSFTSGGVVYASSTSALATGSALTFDGTNLGLGVTPSAWNAGNVALQIANGAAFGGLSGGYTVIGQNYYGAAGADKYIAAIPASRLYLYQKSFIWQQAGTGAVGGNISWTSAMTLDASGNLLVGATSFDYTANGVGLRSNAYSYFTATSASPVLVNLNGTVGTLISLNYASSAVGSISTNGVVTSYNTTSDQRLKENILDANSASSLIDSLQVRQFDWKKDQTHQRYGFVAQELVTVYPEAVHQPVDPDDMMAVDYSKLVPMLVKEIQSLRKRILTLENK